MRAACVLCLALCLAAGNVRAQVLPIDHHTAPTAILNQARAAMDRGEHERAANLALSVINAQGNAQGKEQPATAPAMDPHDRAEAWRIYGLALFFLGRYPAAEIAFVEYLKLDVEGRLDPALFPPEVVSFFEDVRARHAAELRAYRPRPRDRRAWALNLLPPAGQFQNRDHGKGWIIAGTGSVLLATNITTFLVLREWCDASTGVCRSGNESREDEGRLLRSINLVSGALLVGVVAYGVADGFYHYRRAGHSPSIALVPTMDGASLIVSHRY